MAAEFGKVQLKERSQFEKNCVSYNKEVKIVLNIRKDFSLKFLGFFLMKRRDLWYAILNILYLTTIILVIGDVKSSG